MAKHGVVPEEAEQVLWRAPQVRRARLDRYIAIGPTEEGRYLLVVFRALGGGVVRVITARDATPREKRAYGTK
jgi:uncharacterized DUF497 family protein